MFLNPPRDFPQQTQRQGDGKDNASQGRAFSKAEMEVIWTGVNSVSVITYYTESTRKLKHHLERERERVVAAGLRFV